jgi:hypothetical protein
MKAQLVNSNKLLKKKREKNGRKDMEMKKKKEAPPTYQSTPNFVECALKTCTKHLKQECSKLLAT